MSLFSNHSEFEHWAASHCDRCTHQPDDAEACELLDAALFFDGALPPEVTLDDNRWPVCAKYERRQGPATTYEIGPTSFYVPPTLGGA